MAIARDIEDPNHPLAAAGITLPPNDLYSDEPEFDSGLHLEQLMVLMGSLDWLWRGREDYYAVGNISIYYSLQQVASKKYPGPDFFVVLGAQPKSSRRSWMVWEEDGKYPNLIVELLSDETAAEDRGEKKQIYQDIFRTPDYFWFDPYTEEFAGFHLVDGRYEPLDPNEHGWLWSQQLELFLGVHEGQLRFFAPKGKLVPVTEEAAIQEKQRADQAEAREARERQLRKQEKQRADRAQQEATAEREKNARLAERLRSLGIDPDDL